jgi:UDP-glucose 4-epimerase
MNENVLVTGGLGYLGGRLSKHLAGRDNWSPRLTSRRTGAAPPTWTDGMEVVAADFGGDDDFSALCRDVDAVVHLAALNAGQCADDPDLAERVNVTGTKDLFDAAGSTGVRRFVYVSTAHVYGAPLEGVLDEDSAPRPVHAYGETHLAAEEIVLSGDGPEGIALRLSNAIGAPADAGANCWMLAANDLCRQGAAGGDLVLHGNGLDVRDFVPLLDVCRAVDHFLALDNDAMGDRVFNVGGETMTMLALAERIAGRVETVLGDRPAIRCHKPDLAEEALRLDYRIDRLLGTGFTLAGNIDDEIDATLELCRNTFA